jgi:hypothetical protein
MTLRDRLTGGSLLFAFFIALACLFNSPAAKAQTMIPLPGYGSAYSGNVRGLWFTAPCNFRIVGVRVPTNASTGNQAVQIVRINTTIANFTWANTTTLFTTLGYWYNVAGTGIIACDIPVQTGDYIGVLGQRSTYTNYSITGAPFASTLNGLPISLGRFGYQGSIASGSPATSVWTEPGSYAIGNVEVYYTVSTAPNDAGIVSIDSPNNFCPGQQDITVRLKNNGVNQITTCTINWTFNGVPQSPYTWNGLLDTLTPASREAQVVVGSRVLSAGVPYTIRAWTSMPNGVPDTVNSNDTIQVTRQAAMTGIFTIGGTGATYPNFAAAVAALVANGLCGPVTFNVRAGTYNEQVTIPPITGASAANTVTFQSETGVRSSVVLTYSASSTTAHTLLLNGADYVTIKDMTLEGLGASYAQTLTFQAGADYNTIQNCVVRTAPTTSGTTNITCVYSPSGSADNYNTFRNNLFENGSYGTYWYGATSAPYEQGTVWEGNTFTGAYYAYKLYAYYQNNATYRNNTILNTSSYSSAYMMYLYYNMGQAVITGNKVVSTTASATTVYGIYSYGGGTINSVGQGPLIANNFFTLSNGSGTVYGMYLYYGSQARVYNNTMYIGSTYSLSRALYLYYGDNYRIKNNILYCAGGSVPTYHYNTSTTVAEMDYNVMYTTGAAIGYWNAAAVANLATWKTTTGFDANTISTTISYTDQATGDLHLAGASQNDASLTGVMLTDVPVDIDGDVRVVPYRGADEACYVLPSEMGFSFVDASGTPKTWYEAPGTAYVNYFLRFPNFDVSLTVTLKFVDVNTNQVVWQTNFTAQKQAGVPLSGIAAIQLPGSLPAGAYRVEGTFNTKNSCGAYIDFPVAATSVLIVPQGAVPCEVWPGDVNNNGAVNYGDRSALNKYIQNANLRATWLYGPRRYRADAATNPMTYYTWVGQASSPWNTPEGCYMDTDGSGMINSFDYIAIRVNWLRSHGAAPKDGPANLLPETFDMAQNYPNPFNPSTVIALSVPEASRVDLVVTDVLGREVATLVSGELAAGVHRVTFDASKLPSGRYLATVRMTGASGMTFAKTITMTVAK